MLLALFFAWNVSQMFEELEAKRSIMIHRVKVTHPLLYQCSVMIVLFIFSVMAGLIDCRDTFHIVLCL